MDSKKAMDVGGSIMTVCENTNNKVPSKRVNIVSIKMVREGSILYDVRKIGSPSDAVDLGRRFLEEADREQLIVCCLDTKNQPLSVNVASIGSLNSSIVHPREVFKIAILSNAASIIIFHNHPSGDVSPSSEDVNITERLKEAGKIIGIEIIDHIIIGAEGRFCSLKEKGIL
ncbi:DNA repair protein RadC [Clostridium sp. P21]|uniref:DNA repair protein RadC n=2 Tax=Clostridium muellerianum TaxID=2716538 RepID=A0A7Y0EKL8_9CLOT|nr:DNA repair protein RadC [Clostridium muellerianum]